MYLTNCSIKICKLVKNFTILPTITVDQAGYDSNIEMPQFGNKDKLEMSDITLLPAINSSKTMQLSMEILNFFLQLFIQIDPLFVYRMNVTMLCPPIHGGGLECHLLPETNLFCALTLHFYCMFRVFVLLLASQDVFLFSCTLVLLYNL